MDKFEIIVASAPDRERLVAEVYYDSMYWAEISQEKEQGPLIVQFYSHPKGKYWEFTLDETMAILAKAKKALIDMDIPRVIQKLDYGKEAP